MKHGQKYGFGLAVGDGTERFTLLVSGWKIATAIIIMLIYTLTASYGSLIK